MEIDLLYDKFLASGGVCTDTRLINTNDLFFALKGPNFNGNRYAQQALEKGASFVVVDEPVLPNEPRAVLVANVLAALQNLAAYRRQLFDIPIIAVTGSNGKTTTKELCHKVLSQKYKTYATVGNLNNHIGLPLSLLRMPKDTEIALLEMGDNQLGDVAALCQIARPTHGFITNIGKDHIGGFGSFENNLRAKSEVYDYLIKTKGTVFVHKDDQILANMARRIEAPVWYGKNEGAYPLSLHLQDSPLLHYRTGDRVVTTHFFGSFNLENIALAVCIGRFFNVEETAIHQAIANYSPSNNRSQLIEKRSNILLSDAYNANPSSVVVALESLQNISTGKQKTAILGDMLELGTIAEAEHREVIEKVERLGIRTFFIGSIYTSVSSGSTNSFFFKDKDDFLAYLAENPFQDSVILLKGSRGLKLETLLEAL